MSDKAIIFAISQNGTVTPLDWPEGIERLDQLYGWLPIGVYSSWRTFQKRFCLGLDAHLARTERSIRLLGWDFVWDERPLRVGIDRCCQESPFEEAQVRLDILAATVPGWSESRVMISFRPLKAVPALFYEEGVGVQIVTGLKRERPLVKEATFVQTRASYEVGTQELYEIVLRSEEGHLLEGGSSNIYFYKDQILYVGGEQLLQGVTRKIVLQLAEEAGILCTYESLLESTLDQVDEAFLTSSSRGIVPIVRVDQTIIGDGVVGLRTEQLMEAYDLYLKEHLKAAI